MPNFFNGRKFQVLFYKNISKLKNTNPKTTELVFSSSKMIKKLIRNQNKKLPLLQLFTLSKKSTLDNNYLLIIRDLWPFNLFYFRK